jgi:hypothetical protein
MKIVPLNLTVLNLCRGVLFEGKKTKSLASGTLVGTTTAMLARVCRKAVVRTYYPHSYS